MNISKKFALALGAALCIGASAWAEPSIAVNRVQQRYPWNGNVDIDYTVSGVDEPDMFHVEFTLSRSDGSEVKMSSFSNIEQLVQAPNGKRRATWESARDGQKFFDANATLHATLVADGGNKEFFEYYYLIVDLTGGDTYSFTRVFQDVPASDFTAEEYKTTKLVLRRVSPGTYYMGTTPNDKNVDSTCTWCNKETRHLVTITKPFLLGVYEVTQKQWQLVMGAVPAGLSKYGDTVPVANVAYSSIRGATDGCDVTKLGTGSGAGAVDPDSFMGRLRARTGLADFDLPTEGQWEYACRAETDVETYTVGGVSKSLGDISWNLDNCNKVLQGVGGRLANDWGFYDMIGNVYELCRDRVAEGKGINGAASDDWGANPVTDPIRAQSGGTCTSRGGSCEAGANRGRSAFRGGNVATTAPYAAVGFRVGFMGL